MYQRCGTGTAGTTTFCLSATGTVMHSDSRTGFGPGSNIKYITIVKNEKLEATFLRDNAALSSKKAIISAKNSTGNKRILNFAHHTRENATRDRVF
jgi:hypothetical protein